MKDLTNTFWTKNNDIGGNLYLRVVGKSLINPNSYIVESVFFDTVEHTYSWAVYSPSRCLNREELEEGSNWEMTAEVWEKEVRRNMRKFV